MSKELPRHERQSSSSSSFSSPQPPPPTALSGISPFDCNLNLKTLLGFISTRVLRGGPRLVIQLILAIFTLILLGNFFTSPSSDIISSGPRWSWSPFGTNSNDGDVVGTGQPGGVRLIVFGSPDIATPPQGKGNGWTEMLCKELACSSYHSFISQTSLPAQALTAHAHYNATIDKVTSELNEEKAPGYNYDFILDQYPLARAIADVTAQVDQFLAQPQPRSPPKETVWVFTFGTWDIWTLATLPRDLGQGIVDLTVREMFAQVERLYQASLDTKSVAFSDFWAYQDADVIEKLNKMDKERGGGEIDEREVENFRVIIPDLFDVSLTPGWHAQRQSPPSPHTKAEQMTNAAHLTSRWNSEIKGRMDEWQRIPDPETQEQEGAGAGGKERRIRDSQAGYIPASRRASPKLRRAPAVRRARLPEPTRNDAAADVLRVPFPRRAAAQVNTAEFVREAIIERQMRQHDLTDSVGRGNRSEPDRGVYFAETWTPCIWAKTGETPEAAGGGYSACDTPGDYLFHSPFTLSARAIEFAAQIAAAETREKLALAEAPVEERDRETNNKEMDGKTARVRVRRNEKRGASTFQPMLKPNRALRIVDDSACPTLDVC